MSFEGNRQLTILFTCPSQAIEEGEAMFARHADWMKRTHHKDGDLALTLYNVARGPELANSLDPSSAPTGRTTFALTEIYAKRAGLEDHWRRGTTQWEDFEQFASFASKCRITTSHGSEIIQSLW